MDSEQRGLSVRVKNNDVNKAMRKLKKLTQQEGLLQDLRKKEFYEPPSVVRKRKKAKAIKRWQKKIVEQAEMDSGFEPKAKTKTKV